MGATIKNVYKSCVVTILVMVALLCAVPWPVLHADIELNSGADSSSDIGLLFAQKPQADLYWKALMHIAKNNRELALKIVTAIKTNNVAFLINVSPVSQPGSINECFDDLFVTIVSHNPQALSFLGLFESIGIREHNAYLNNVSPEAIVDDFNHKKICLNRLKTYSLDRLSADQQVSYKIFCWIFDQAVQGEKFLFHEYEVFPIFSELIAVFTQYHRLEVPEDVENYLIRLSRIPDQLKQTIALLTYQKSHDIQFPLFAIQKLINRIKNLMSPLIADNIFYTHFAANLDKIQGVDKKDVLLRAQSVIKTQVYPALKLLQDHCTQLLETAHTNYGVWALPGGDDYYAFMLKRHTTTNLSADEIHELGLKEIATIQREMRKIFAREGIVDDHKGVGELIQELAKEPRFYYPQSDEGRKQCLAQYETILARCRKDLYPLFDLKPKMPIKIQAVPKQEEEYQSFAYYQLPSMDGLRPGILFANLRNMREVPTYVMETRVIHEAEPGHHFQIALQQELDMPILRKFSGFKGEFTAYSEGWALYAEKLAYEHGFYSSSFDQLGHLQDELFRAVRLVVDTGIHKKRWTREQAIDYMVKMTGMHRGGVVTEVERYFVWPGQACAYKIGQLKILELRNRAQQALREKFDIREFHNVVLKLGDAPLTILEEVVDQYIQQMLPHR